MKDKKTEIVAEMYGRVSTADDDEISSITNQENHQFHKISSYLIVNKQACFYLLAAGISSIFVIAFVISLVILKGDFTQIFNGDTDRYISNRAVEKFDKPGLVYLNDFFECTQSLFSSENPSGCLPLAVAENNLMRSELFNRLHNYSQFSTNVLNYAPAVGKYHVRLSIANFLSSFVFKLNDDNLVYATIDSLLVKNSEENSISSKYAVNPDHLCLSTGVTSILSTLSLLLFEAGDAVIIPSPFYYNFINDLGYIGDVVVEEAQLFNPSPLGNSGHSSSLLTEYVLDKAFRRSRRKGNRPRALLLTNPNNPLGTVYSRSELLTAATWCKSKKLHLIVDEIYALSVFSSEDFPGETINSSQGNRSFVSIVNVLNNSLGNDVHVLWGLSKDFGASGLRLGVLYSQNLKLLKYFGSVGFQFTSSNMVQEFAANLLSDRDFVESFIRENRLRLSMSYKALLHGLNEIGIKAVAAQAGLFCVVDLRPLMKSITWESEALLQEELVSMGIVLTPGFYIRAPIPGFFRICYAWVSVAGIEELIRRLKLVTLHKM